MHEGSDKECSKNPEELGVFSVESVMPGIHDICFLSRYVAQ